MRSAVFLLTHKCNFRCTFCLNIWKEDEQHDAVACKSKSCCNQKKDLCFKEVKKSLKRLWKLGIQDVVFSGGEPTMRKDFLKIVDYAHGLGFSLGMQTNGFFLDKKLLKRLKGKMDYIQISIEGLEKEHNALTRTQSFRRVVEALKLVVKEGIPLRTNFTITKMNKACVQEYVPFLNEIGVEKIQFTRLFHAGEARHYVDDLLLSKVELYDFLKELSALEQEDPGLCIELKASVPQSFLKANGIYLKRVFGCAAGLSECAVQPNGDITPCPSDSQVIGNILEPKLSLLRNRILENKIRRLIEAKEGCKVCYVEGEDPYSEIIPLATIPGAVV